ncbi:60S acidic ribosomal protein P1-like [Phalaenopsis equestris]|uniref:60S acidic ribosomal protein P1-like n=1 Tax=Phalaenopsis equestris TaxID=78828 RepID=UPI0009E2ECEA|nr:60S acidic ribosomal protein P1-like [Phalaenopsis equestris]
MSQIRKYIKQPTALAYGTLAMSSISERSLAALILYDDGIPITAEKISTLLKSANISVESFWATLIAKLLEKKNVDDLILNVGSGGGGATVTVAATAAGGGGGAAEDSAPAVEEKKEEPKEESDEDMGFSLFD